MRAGPLGVYQCYDFILDEAARNYGACFGCGSGIGWLVGVDWKLHPVSYRLCGQCFSLVLANDWLDEDEEALKGLLTLERMP